MLDTAELGGLLGPRNTICRTDRSPFPDVLLGLRGSRVEPDGLTRVAVLGQQSRDGEAQLVKIGHQQHHRQQHQAEGKGRRTA